MAGAAVWIEEQNHCPCQGLTWRDGGKCTPDLTPLPSPGLLPVTEVAESTTKTEGGQAQMMLGIALWGCRAGQREVQKGSGGHMEDHSFTYPDSPTWSISWSGKQQVPLGEVGEKLITGSVVDQHRCSWGNI